LKMLAQATQPKMIDDTHRAAGSRAENAQ
jgi:hypothetical protein